MLGIDEKDISAAENVLKRLHEKSDLINVKCMRGGDVALFFENAGFAVGNVVLGVYNEYAYDKCACLSSDTRVSLDYRDSLSGDGLILDLSEFDDEIASRVGFERLLYILGKAEELCL